MSIEAKNTTVLNRIAIAISIAIPALIAILFYLPKPTSELPFNVYILPQLHAIINALTVVTLVAALFFIKQKNIKAHQFSINIAMVLSVLFLLSYVIYHWATEPTRYGGEGFMKGLYLFLLLTHIVLAAVIVPFVLFTYIRGYSMQVEKHRKIAKWTYPMWLYVAVTGVICYLMLAPYYPQ